MQTNLLLEVVRLSLSLSGRFLSPYGHLKSWHKFTQPQLMTCLVLHAYLKTTYRGVIDVLAASQELRESIGLKRLPHYSTLKRFWVQPLAGHGDFTEAGSQFTLMVRKSYRLS